LKISKEHLEELSVLFDKAEWVASQLALDVSNLEWRMQNNNLDIDDVELELSELSLLDVESALDDLKAKVTELQDVYPEEVKS